MEALHDILAKRIRKPVPLPRLSMEALHDILAIRIRKPVPLQESVESEEVQELFTKEGEK